MSGSVDDGLGAAREAVNRARDAVEALGTRVDALGPAIELLLTCQGRVVITGLGKSGLIGAKLAATFASTGTSAFFVHAADALHGDVGAIGADDVVIAISNSGETDEVCVVADVLRQRGVKVIALTGCGGSSRLGAAAAVHLDVAVERECDPHDLVPSASTTAAIVMGDALAIAVMVARGFGPDDFHRHHPSGALGRRLSDERG